jgi:hypothetical protein
LSILREGNGLDWTGTRQKTGPVQGVKLGMDYQALNVNQMKDRAVKKPKKSKFGFF